MSLRIGINGFGRIGRALARLIIQKGEFELVALNDPTDVEMSAYLLKYDSVHKHFTASIHAENDGLFVNGTKIRYSRSLTLEGADFSGCDIVYDCSGQYTTTETLQGHLRGEIKKVILSAMPHDDMPVYVFGLSDRAVLQHDIISAGSCSTNALALILDAIEQSCGPIDAGSVTSVHSYTTDQNIVDGKNDRGLRNTRAADMNIIPVGTGVVRNLDKVMPHLADRLIGFSVRVPVPSVTMLDITLSMQKSVTIDAIKNGLEEAAAGRYAGLLDLDRDARVSSDFVSGCATVTVATDLTQMTGKNNVKIIGWFDNESGYTNRLYDLISQLKESF